MDMPREDSIARFRKLYPDLPESELAKAQDNFRRYVALALRIYEAICANPERYAQFKALTVRDRAANLESRQDKLHPNL